MLATGCRERPRSARLVPGQPAGGRDDDRHAPAARLPAGRRPATRALIVGAEHVSFSALVDARPRRRARGRGWSPSCRATSRSRLFRLGAPLRYRAPVWTRTARQRDPRPPAGGGGRADRPRQRRDPHGRVRHGRLHRRLDPRPRAGRDGRARARPGHARARRRPGAAHLAAGRLRGGQPAARRRDGRRGRAERPPRGGCRRPLPARTATGRRGGCAIVCETPVGWIAPSAVAAPTGRPADASLLRSRAFVRAPRVELVQDERTLWRGRVARMMPGRSARLTVPWTQTWTPAAGRSCAGCSARGKRAAWSTKSRPRSWRGGGEARAARGGDRRANRRGPPRVGGEGGRPAVPGAQPEPPDDEEDRTARNLEACSTRCEVRSRLASPRCSRSGLLLFLLNPPSLSGAEGLAVFGGAAWPWRCSRPGRSWR